MVVFFFYHTLALPCRYVDSDVRLSALKDLKAKEAKAAATKAQGEAQAEARRRRRRR